MMEDSKSLAHDAQTGVEPEHEHEPQHEHDADTSVESLKHEIAETRQRIAESAEALAYKTDVQSRVADVADDARERVTGAVSEAAQIASVKAGEFAAEAKVVIDKTLEQATQLSHEVAAQVGAIAQDRIDDANAAIDDPAGAVEAVKLRSRRSPITWTLAFVAVALAYALSRRRG